jgi:hypothetical protein
MSKIITLIFILLQTSFATAMWVYKAARLSKMPGLVRTSFLGGALLPMSPGDGDHKAAPASTALIGIGDGMISAEVGGMIARSGNTTFFGAPVTLKYNYIEMPLSTFFVKVGALPLTDGTHQTILFNGGIGGTAPLTQQLAFVLDLSLVSGFEQSSTKAFLPMAGLSYDF